jgi:hypothetical protein
LRDYATIHSLDRRHRRPMSKKLTYAYTAGLIDGEGTISLSFSF